MSPLECVALQEDKLFCEGSFSKSPYLPRTPFQLEEESEECSLFDPGRTFSLPSEASNLCC